ncbi:hypothetical protein [Streptococcus suis]|uniref:hypothetical protein n=1 Tax=Streptococcus suis TaxID=1307 RepID=UPI0013A56557|nr:hypothetical protein [Streptococcus suis]
MLIFDDNPYVAVVICKHISEENKTITYISHDLEDGMWQFLCGDIHDIADVQLIALVEILQFGITETLLNQIPYGFEALLDQAKNWQISRKEKP